MRVLVLFVTASLVAGCAGRSAPDADPAPAVAATGEQATGGQATGEQPTGEQPTDVKTIQASSITGNEPTCTRRPVTGSIISKRVCQGQNTGVDEAVSDRQIRDTLQDLERTHTTGGLVIR